AASAASAPADAPPEPTAPAVIPAVAHPDPAGSEPQSPSCAAGMALVEGGYCAAVEERCVAYQEVPGSAEHNQCRKYAAPTECVILPRNTTPHRSCIKGGWWGPVRSRCRPTVTFHDEGDWGYEVGFRCCADAAAP